MSEYADFEDSLREEFSDRGLTETGHEAPVPEETTTPRLPEGSEVQVEEPESTQPRDEQGRFTSPTPDDPTADRLREKDRVIGSMADELGTLRREVEQLRTSVETPPPVSLDQTTVDWFDQVAEENPQQAALWALQNNNDILYERAMSTWADIDPRGATRFEVALATHRIREELRSEVAPAQQAAQSQEFQRNFNQAWLNVSEQFPDLNAHADAILQVAEQNQSLLADIHDPARMQTVIENLYFRAQHGQLGAVRHAANDAASYQQQQAARDKIAATVASASSQPAARDEKSPQDRFIDSIIDASNELTI